MLALPELQAKTGEEKSVRAFAEMLGVSYERLTNIIEKNNIELVSRRSVRKALPSLTLAAQNQIRALPEFAIEAAKEGELSVHRFAKSLGVHGRKIYEVIAEHDIPTIERRFGTKTGTGLTAEAQAQIKAILESREA